MSDIDTDYPRLSDAPMGEVTLAGDTLQVVFRRTYRKPIEKVWAALTIPERLGDWFGNAEVDLRVGGHMTIDGNGMQQTIMRIAVCEPPHALAWVWTIAGRDSLVRFDLATEPDGCRLTLTHSGVPRSGAGVRPGWHALLEGLTDAIDGQSTPWTLKTAREIQLKAIYPRLAD